MLDSLLKVEEGMKGSAKELFQMFADSLKLLYQDQQTKQSEMIFPLTNSVFVALLIIYDDLYRII